MLNLTKPIQDIEQNSILKVPPFNEFGTPMEIVRLFGGKPGYEAAILELENQLYANQ